MTIWVPDLDRSKPLYLAIADAMARDVESGTLQQGTRLPPQRDLAWKLGVTLGTVTRAYREAEQRGLLAGEVGRGSYVRLPRAVPSLEPPAADSDDILDLSHAIPPPTVKGEEFDQAMQFVMRDAHKLNLLDYAPAEGFPMHRAMGARWLTRSGIEVAEKDVLLSAGAHLGLITVLEALGIAGETVLTERTTYALLRTTLRNAHLVPAGLAMDDDGLLPDALERQLRLAPARMLYLVPSLQNPTTTTMSRGRREDLVRIARKHDLTIIEDDIFRLLDARVQPPTFYELAPERTFHITSLSKTLAPGLRIGFVVSPQGQERVLHAHVRTMAARTSGITGEIARYWIETDMASTILARSQAELAARRAAFLDIMKGQNVRCSPGAPYAWLELPDHWTPVRFTQALAVRKIKVTPGNLFEVDPAAASRHVRICFGQPKAAWRVRAAFEDIVSLLRDRDEADFTPVA